MSNISCILYPPTVDYHYLVQRPQHLMKNFSELGILSFFMNNPHLHQQQRQGIERINPYLYLFNGVEPAGFLKDINPVIYYSATAHVDMIKKYRPSLVVFDSVDEPSDEFAGWRPYYHRAVATADIVLASSDKLYQMAKNINPHCFLVPNACEYGHFSNSGQLANPTDMLGIGKPIIGYFGAIATWVDLALLDRAAAQLPEYNFVMLGPRYNVFELPQRPNLHWLGFKDYEKLPAYAQSFDVGLIPFKLSDMTESVNPIKMWEYMASGMPVVTTALPEAYKIRELLYYSENEEEFIENIKKALDENNPSRREARMEVARQNSWSARAAEIIDIIEGALEQKGIRSPANWGDKVRKSLLPGIVAAGSKGIYRNNLNSHLQIMISSISGHRYSVYPRRDYPDRGCTGKGKSLRIGGVAVTRNTSFRFYTRRHRKILGAYYR